RPPPRPTHFPYTTLFRSYLMLGNQAAAENQLRRAVELKPLSGEAHRDFAIVLRQSGKLDDCIRELRLAGRFLPDDSAPHFMLGRSEEHTSELQSRFDLVC